MANFQIPSAIKEILDIPLQNFGFDLIKKTAIVTIELGRSLDFFNGLVLIEAPIVTLIVDRSNVNIHILGNTTLLGTSVELKLVYFAGTDQFTISTEIISTSFNFRDIVEELTTLSFPLIDKFNTTQQKFEIKGSIDNASNGIVIISTVSTPDHFLILKRDNGTLKTAVVLGLTDISINDVIWSFSGQDISSMSFINAPSLPKVGFALSTGLITSELISESFKNSMILGCYGDTIPSGTSGFFRLFEQLYQMDYHDNMVSLTIKEGVLIAQNLLRLMSVDLSRIQIPPIIGNIFDVEIQHFGLDLTKGRSFILIPYDRVITFFNGLFSIDVPIITLIVDKSSVSIETLGNVNFFGTPVELKLYYSPNTNQFHVLSDFHSASLRFENIVEEFTSLSLPLPRKFRSSSDGFKIIGTVDESLSNGILVFSVSIGLGNKNRAFLIVKRDNNVLETAIAVDIASIMLSDLVQSVTGLSETDFSQIPFIGTASLPEMGLVLSSSSISSDLFYECFNDTFLLQCFGNTLPKGVSGFLGFDFSTDIYKISYLNETITFITKSGDLSVRKVLNLVLLPLDFQRIRIPSFLGDILDTDVNNFGLSLPQNKIFLDFELSKIDLFGGQIRLSLPSIMLHVPLTNSNDMEVKVKTGQFSFGSVDFDFQINKESDGKYVFDANCDYMPLSSLVTGFSAKILPKNMQPPRNFLSFGIKKFNMEFPLESGVSKMFLSGKPVIAGYTVTCMTAVVVKDENNAVDIVLDLDLGSANLANVLGEIVPPLTNILKLIPFINQEIDFSLIMSPKKLTDITLSRVNEQISIEKGITIKGEIPFPSRSSCGSDPFCLFLTTILPDNTILHIDSTIIDANNFQLMAGFTLDINLGGLTITHAGMELRVAGLETSIGVIGKLSLQNPRLDFTIRLYFSETGMTLGMIAAGCWRDAFDLPIDICDVHGSVSIGPTLITELSIGGQVRLGGKCNRPPLVAIGHVGLNTMNPRKNFYYASFPEGLTIADLLQIFCISSSSLPSPIADTGLQPGFQSSFSPVEKVIPEIDVYIPRGFNVNGAVNIFGFQVKGNISILPEQMNLAVQLDPIEIGSIFYMYASSNDRTKGPYLIAEIKSNQLPVVEASGYIHLLGFSVGASLAITKESMSASVEGRILNIIDARITITAPAISSLSSAEFEVKGHVKSSFFDVIESAITEGAEGLADVTNEAVGAAQTVLDTASQVFDSASNGLAGARRAVERLQGEFNRAVGEVNRLIRRVDSICHRRNCGSSKCQHTPVAILKI